MMEATNRPKRSVVGQAAAIGIPFGITMALFWWIFGELTDRPNSLAAVLGFGLISAVIFGLLLTVYERWRWGEVNATPHPDFSRDGAIILETPAIHDSRNGWLATNGTELLFRVDSENYRDLHINLSRVVSVRDWTPVGSSRAGLEVHLANGGVERFEVEDVTPWNDALQSWMEPTEVVA